MGQGGVETIRFQLRYVEMTLVISHRMHAFFFWFALLSAIDSSGPGAPLSYLQLLLIFPSCNMLHAKKLYSISQHPPILIVPLNGSSHHFNQSITVGKPALASQTLKNCLTCSAGLICVVLM
jgi:hypothetical protein